MDYCCEHWAVQLVLWLWVDFTARLCKYVSAENVAYTAYAFSYNAYSFANFVSP